MAGTLGGVELILLHGFDATPADLSDVAESLRSALNGWTVRTIAGPVDIGGGRLAWWTDGDVSFPDARHALAWISEQIGTEPVVIAGFSQGGALALACGFGGAAGDRSAQVRSNVRAVACIGGFLPDDVMIAPTSVALFVGHGVADEVVDVFHAESLGRSATRHGVENVVILHDGGHEWPAPITDSLASWLRGLAQPSTEPS